MSLDRFLVSPWRKQEIEEVLEAYGLGVSIGKPDYPQGWDRARASCVVQTPQGRFFLKKHHPEALRRESHNVQLLLAKNKIPVLTPLVHSGAVSWYDSDSWIAETYFAIDAKPRASVTETEALEMSSVAGRIHESMRECPLSSHVGWHSDKEYFGQLDKLQKMLPKSLWKEFHKSVSDTLNELGTIKSGTEKEKIHGDLWRGNWLFSKKGLAALIDFDFLHSGYRMSDLSDLLHAGAGIRDDATLNWERPFRVELARRMVGCYSLYTTPLTGQECHAFGCWMRDSWWKHILPRLIAGDDHKWMAYSAQMAIVTASDFGTLAADILS